MGSANLNDRSQKGDGDSEIALVWVIDGVELSLTFLQVVEDSDMIESTMDGKPYQVARFAATLRRSLFKGRSFLMASGAAN